jgi:hypothetical protein
MTRQTWTDEGTAYRVSRLSEAEDCMDAKYSVKMELFAVGDSNSGGVWTYIYM